MTTPPDFSRRRFLALAGFACVPQTMPGETTAGGGLPATPKHPMKELRISRAGSQPSAKGSADWFTGTVRIDPLFQADGPARTGAAAVTFEPGARTAWHTHPLGQTLIITAGKGWVQHEGGPVHEVFPGDVIQFPPGLRHWHGAAPDTAMTHIAIQEQLDGKAVEWMEPVSGAQYTRQS